MNLNLESHARRHGFALIATMCLTLTMLIVFTSMFYWTSSVAKITQFNNQYVMSQAAAEAMTEMALGAQMRDYAYGSLNSNLSVYTPALAPAAQTNADGTSWPIQYWFSDVTGSTNALAVIPGVQQSILYPLGSQFGGLSGYPWFWTNIVTATPIGQPYTVPVTITQVINYSSVPVFQFAIFYNINLEIDPGASMFVNGPVFSNQGIWAGTDNLTFNNTVQAVAGVNITSTDPFCLRKTDANAPPHFTMGGQPSTASTAITLPIGGDNVEAILNIPPAATFGMGTPAAYTTNGEVYVANVADLIISNAIWGTNVNPLTLTLATKKTNNISIWYQDQSGSQSNYLTPLTPDYYVFATNPPTGKYTNWISGNLADGKLCYTNVVYAGWSFATNAAFYDYRELATVQAVSLSITNLAKWLTNTAANGGSNYNRYCGVAKGRLIDGIWVYNDVPFVTNGTLPAVRVADASTMPTPNGLSVATPMPIYVWGNYNSQISPTQVSSGTNTANTYPAALMGDAITVLSSAWSDSYNSGTSLSSRNATAITINAACLEGIVQSFTNSTTPNGPYGYSGGTENFLRFLENWSGVSTTYNGAIVVMFPSIFATSSWITPGTYYNAPVRNWGFDYNFTHQNLLPPMAPCLKKTVRVSWAAN